MTSQNRLAAWQFTFFASVLHFSALFFSFGNKYSVWNKNYVCTFCHSGRSILYGGGLFLYGRGSWRLGCPSLVHSVLQCWISPTITFDSTVGLVLCFSTENGVQDRPQGRTLQWEKFSTGVDKTGPECKQQPRSIVSLAACQNCLLRGCLSTRF